MPADNTTDGLGLNPGEKAMQKAYRQIEESQSTADAIAAYLAAGGGDPSGLLMRSMNALDNMLHMSPPPRNLS